LIQNTSAFYVGHVVEFSQDQNGSRFIQQRLEIADETEKALLLDELLSSIKRIRNDVFGNYVVQKLFQHGSSEAKAKLFRQALLGEVIPLSKMIYGCRVVQKALECLDNEELSVFVYEFKGRVVECILDQNGNHVIQKCIEVYCVRAKNAENQADTETARFLRQICQFIMDESLDSLRTLSCHPYGCRVIQRIIEHSVDPYFSRVLDTIVMNHKELIDDQFGNYVIQHSLQFGRTVDKESIMNTVLESGLARLSRQKYASNVVEKLLKFGTPSIRGTMIKDMLKEQDCLLSMVRDAYANYVVQTALDVAPEGHIKRLLLQDLGKHSSQLVSAVGSFCMIFIMS
jgi:pumilio RNA-binding family